MSFDYFYGAQADMFSFLRIPKLLLTDARYSGISSDAKLLYSIMLDRMGLSATNGWMDRQGRVYIVYTIDEVCQTFGISKATAVKCMAELDTKSGIGLIERVRVGLGRADRIYVLNFVNDCPVNGGSDHKSNSGTSGSGVHKNGPGKESASVCGNQTEPPNALSGKNTPRGGDNPQKYKNYTSAPGIKNIPQEVIKFYPNNTEKNNTTMLSISHINQSTHGDISTLAREGNDWLTAQEYESIQAEVAEQIEADTLREEHGKVIDEIIELITEVMTSQEATIRVAGADRSTEVLRLQFARLTAAHVEAALWNLQKHAPEPITNVRAYMRTLLLDTIFSLHTRITAAVVT